MDKTWKFRMETLVFTWILVVACFAERTKDKMYEKIEGTNGCYRRLNATHQIGCSSKRGGSTGVIHYCATQTDLDFILNNGTSPPYIPVIPTNIFTRTNVEKMSKTSVVSGLVLYNITGSDVPFTHENQCPNEGFNVGGTCDKTWNPHGTGMLYLDIPFPIFYVDKTEDLTKIRQCFQKFNNYSFDSHWERSLCSLQLNSFMYATTNTPTCRRRSNIVTNLNPVKFCDPLGDHNVWSTLFPLVDATDETKLQPLENKKYILVAARLDTTSMFEMTAGADSPVTGVVALLLVAKFLKDLVPLDQKFSTNVLFVFFNGETYEYIGSQRLLYDMKNGDFPLKSSENNSLIPPIRPEDITMFIELSQLGKTSEGLNAHYLQEQSQIKHFLDNLEKYSTIKFRRNAQSLPPASLHTFIRNDMGLPGVVLADHSTAYANLFYNSVYDTAENIGFVYRNNTDVPKDSVQWHVGSVALAVARSICSEVTNASCGGKPVEIDWALVDELFHCYLENPNCLVNNAVQRNKLPSTPLSLYVGVQIVSNFATSVTALILGWFTGDIVGPSDGNCTNQPDNIFRFYNMSVDIHNISATKCFKITFNSTEAVSPAFVIDDYDWSSGKYSSWAESTWNHIDMRMFLRPSVGHESLTMATGTLSMILSFVVVYFIKSRSHVLFTSPLPMEPPTDC